LRAVSDTISMLIMYSAILIISLLMSMYAFYNSAQAVSSSEYLYYRQAFQSIALNIPVIVNPYGGGSYTVSFPKVRMGIGWMKYGGINIYVNGTLVQNLSCTAIYTKIDGAISTVRRNVYGLNKGLVEDIRLVPRVSEYYRDGSTYLVLDSCRVLYYLDRVGRYGGTTYYLRLIYVNMNPITSKNSRIEASFVRTYVSRTPVVIEYDNVYGLLINITNIDGEQYTITPRELGIAPPILVTLIIYNVGVEVS